MITLSMPVEGTFTYEMGTWDENTQSFRDIRTKTWTKELTITCTLNDRPIIEFIGGPTGFERYYLYSLEPLSGHDLFCICGGTINSWPRCTVPSKAVKYFIDSVKTLIDEDNK